MFEVGYLYQPTIEAKQKFDTIVHQGGTSSAKTYTIIQSLFTDAIENNNATITVVGQDIPNLKAGALRDALDIVDRSPALKSIIKSYNKSDRIFEFYTGSRMEFKSYDNAQDAKNGKREFLFINEANGISHDIYHELSMRTIERNGIIPKIYVDYNPNAEFWVHKELIGKSNVCTIVSDHRHNPFLAQSTRDKIENLKNKDLELWRVYARGLTGKIEGLVFRNYNVVPGIPAGARFIGYGLDYGFTNDPTAIIEVYLYNGELYVNELVYETGLTNPAISERLFQLGVLMSREIIAENAEPKSNAELSNLGWNIHAVERKDTKLSIDILKRYKINITQRSLNLRKEISAYRWKTTKAGLVLNEPVDINNHAIDALRYIALMKLGENLGRGKYCVR